MCLLLFSLSSSLSLYYLGQWSAVLINFPNTGALQQSGNPSRTVGNGHSNNNNTKYNQNYGLKRLGQSNPQYKHKTREDGSPPVIKCRDGSCVSSTFGAFILGYGDLCEIMFDLSFDGVYFEKQEYVWGSDLLLLKNNITLLKQTLLSSVMLYRTVSERNPN